MDLKKNAEAIEAGRTALGLELGSTNIKMVLVNEACETLASTSYGWENQLENGIWTYDLAKVWLGIEDAFHSLTADVQSRYHVEIKTIGSIGISAMMHGYLPFDKTGKQLAPFRTWRNNITGESAAKLTELFGFNIPQRWSIAHLYQAILNGEEHVKDIAFLTTLAGYVHWQLSGEKVLGIGDASGMFPIDEQTGTYDAAMMEAFGGLDEVKRYPWKLADILPKPLRAGKAAGQLTKEGAWLLDPTGKLQPGALMAPPEGDAGTGMVATNAVRKRTGNISVGTSAFSMNVLDAPLKAVHRDIDIVTTPDGAPVAMVHTNNCSSDLNAWVQLFGEFAELIGHGQTPAKLYRTLFEVSQRADRDAGGLLNYSCLSGENITDVETGRPLFVRAPHSQMNLANFMLAQLYGCFAPLKIGMDILAGEHVAIDSLTGHGGLFKTPLVGQKYMAAACRAPVTCMKSAGEGGPYGMALLAAYMLQKEGGQSLETYLAKEVFADVERTTLAPDAEDEVGFDQYLARFRAALEAEKAAVAAF